MPLKFCLKLVAVVCADSMNTEREFAYHIVDEMDSVLLGMTIVDL